MGKVCGGKEERIKLIIKSFDSFFIVFEKLSNEHLKLQDKIVIISINLMTFLPQNNLKTYFLMMFIEYIRS